MVPARLDSPRLHPSIHLPPLIWGLAVSAGSLKPPFPWQQQPALTGGSREMAIYWHPCQGGNIFSPPGPWSAPRPSPSWTSWGRHPCGFLNRCPNHLNWPVSMQRSSGSTLELLSDDWAPYPWYDLVFCIFTVDGTWYLLYFGVPQHGSKTA